MTPRFARIALCGFAFLAAGVATNALYFQERTGPRVAVERTNGPLDRRSARGGLEQASWSTSRPPAKADQRRLGPFEANTLKLENPPEPSAADGRPDTIRAVQRELRNRGFGQINVDGVPGLATRAAIMAFEADEGLPLTAIANEMLLKQILLGASPPAEDAARKEPGPRAQDVIRATQNWLLALGFQPGPANGLLNAQTQSAIRAFEASVGLTPRGRISADLVKRLADTVPLKSAAR